MTTCTSPAAPGPSAHALALDARVEAEISRLMHAQDPPAIATNFAAALLVGWLHRNTPDQTTLLAWMATWFFCNCVYLGFYFAQRRLLRNDTQSPYLRPLHLIVATFISVLPAGFMPWFFSPTPEALYLNTTLVVIYCSGVFASNTMLSAAAFIVGGATILAPLVVLLFTQHSVHGIGIGIGLALVMYFLFMIPFSLSQSRAIRRAIHAGYENEALAQQLALQTADAEAARAEAEEAVRAKARFLAAATHDLRQPLHALSLTLASLRLQALSTKVETQIAHADECTRHLSVMFDSLLDQARLDAGTIELHLEAVSLGMLFTQLEAQFQPLARSRGLWLRSRPTTAVLRSDRTALWRILSNLVSNALDATDTGGILIAWRGGAHSLEVRDSGCGIAAAHHALIFDEFQRLSTRGGPPGRGLGLGLSTVRRLARLLGGDVSVRSALGKGSVFRVSIDPAQILDDVSSPREAKPRPLPSVPGVRALTPDGDPAQVLDDVSTSPATKSGLRVLAVDDDPAIRAALAMLLPQWGFELRLAANAAEAYAQIEAEWRPQVLLLDRHLPDESGLSLGIRLRAAIEPTPACLIITGDTAPEHLSAMQASGFELLHKPVAPHVLHAALRAFSAQLDFATPELFE